jgi:stage II sporulation protein AA (anti-sigma F factor antagonist)
MIVKATRPLLEVEQIGDVALVTFTSRAILDPETPSLIGKQLQILVKDQGCTRVILDFVNVEKLTTLLVGQVAALHQTIKAAKGRLVLCRINPDVFAIFQILGLHRVLEIYKDEQEALQTF